MQTIATVRVQLSTADLIKQAVNVQKYTVLEYLTFCLGVCGVLRGVGVGGGGEKERPYVLTNSNKEMVFRLKTFQCNIRYTNGWIVLDVMI